MEEGITANSIYDILTRREVEVTKLIININLLNASRHLNLIT